MATSLSLKKNFLSYLANLNLWIDKIRANNCLAFLTLKSLSDLKNYATVKAYGVMHKVNTEVILKLIRNPFNSADLFDELQEKVI